MLKLILVPMLFLIPILKTANAETLIYDYSELKCQAKKCVTDDGTPVTGIVIKEWYFQQQKNGSVSFYLDGERKKEAYTSGEIKTYNYDDLDISSGRFAKDRNGEYITGIVKQNYETGNLQKAEFLIEGGVVSREVFYESGVLKSSYDLSGKVKYYNKEGVLIAEGKYKEEDVEDMFGNYNEKKTPQKVTKFFYKDGDVSEKVEYNEGSKNCGDYGDEPYTGTIHWIEPFHATIYDIFCQNGHNTGHRRYNETDYFENLHEESFGYYDADADKTIGLATVIYDDGKYDYVGDTSYKLKPTNIELYFTEDNKLTLEQVNSKNKNMTYKDKSNLSSYLKDVLNNDKKSYIKNYDEPIDKTVFDVINEGSNGNFWNYVEGLPREIVGFNDYFEVNSEGYHNLGRFKYKAICESSKTISHYNNVYDQSCLAKALAEQQNLYMNCVSQMDRYDGWAKVQYHQNCLEAIENNKEKCVTGTKKTEERVCDKPTKFVITNKDDEDAIIIPLNIKQPDMKGIPYSKIVNALYEKYGPATYSQSFTRGNGRREIFYWVDGSWILRVSAIIKDSGKDVRSAILKRMTQEKQLEYLTKLVKCNDMHSNNIRKRSAWKRCINELREQYPELEIEGLDNWFTFDIDNAEVEDLFITYINKDAFAKQKKYLEEEKQRKIDEQKAELERIEKAKEDKIKNFKL